MLLSTFNQPYAHSPTSIQTTEVFHAPSLHFLTVKDTLSIALDVTHIIGEYPADDTPQSPSVTPATVRPPSTDQEYNIFFALSPLSTYVRVLHPTSRAITAFITQYLVITKPSPPIGVGSHVALVDWSSFHYLDHFACVQGVYGFEKEYVIFFTERPEGTYSIDFCLVVPIRWTHLSVIQ